MLSLFSLTLFLSAALLFVAELMFAKMVLPYLGGTPAVWNTCTVFFQSALLAGYAYAHWTSKWIGVKRHLGLHILLLALPFLILPIAIPPGWRPPADANPIPELLRLMALTVGLPLMMVSTSAPLLQKWFTHAGHRASKDPYFLYAASNAGSFFGLAAYIGLLEPKLTRRELSTLWTYGYGALVALTALCAFLILRARTSSNTGRSEAGDDSVAANPGSGGTLPATGPMTPWRVLRWMLLAAVPASLMLGLTTYLTTDVTAAPLLWVVPLSLYLLTFILAFARWRIIPERPLSILLPALVVLQTIVFHWSVQLKYMAVLHMITFFVAALSCHSRLARDRPSAEHLTVYYLLVSAGGVLGGMFNALLAPLAFHAVLEYPLALLLACLLCARPVVGPARRHLAKGRWKRLTFGWVGLSSLLLAVLVIVMREGDLAERSRFGFMAVLGVIAAVCYAGAVLSYLGFLHPLGFVSVLGLAMLLVSRQVVVPGVESLQQRSYFGVLRVDRYEDPPVTELYHGTTLHGRQCHVPGYEDVPLTYYLPDSPVARVLLKHREMGTAGYVGLIGLGVGALACYADSADNYTFYEIDPAVRDIALDPRWFTFLRNARKRGVNLQVVLGDGRLAIASAPDQAYDIIVLDAFSSDAVPVHLITREALRLYLRKLKSHGTMIFNITNRHMNLAPVIGNICAAEGLVCVVGTDWDVDEEEYERGKTPSTWMFAARDTRVLDAFMGEEGWSRIAMDPRVSVWTDDHSSILEALKFSIRGDRVFRGPGNAPVGAASGTRR